MRLGFPALAWLACAAFFAPGCVYVTKAEFLEYWDADGDGWPIGEDCDDNNPDVYPYAPDYRGDGCDADCGMLSDRDGDDWPDVADCAPDDPTIHPCSIHEVEGDGIDHDCDGHDGVRTLECPRHDPDFPTATPYLGPECKGGTPPDEDPTDTDTDEDPTDTDTDEPTDTDTDEPADTADTGDTGDTATPALCDIHGFPAVIMESAVYGHDAHFFAATDIGYPADLMAIEWRGSWVSGPASYPLAANPNDQKFETCETCVIVGQDCDHYCARYFFVTDGTIHITDIDGDGIVGVLENFVAEEIEIDFQTYATTPVPGGLSWCFTSFAFDTIPECVVSSDCAGNPNGDLCLDGTCGDITCPTTSTFTADPDTESYSGNGFWGRYTARTSGTVFDSLSLELYDWSGSYPITGPGTYELGATSTDEHYYTCDLCLLISEGCELDAYGYEVCDTRYFARRGTLDVTEIDPHQGVLKATLSDVEAIEVDAFRGFDPVPGGLGYCLPSYTIDIGPECDIDADCIGNPNGGECFAGACVDPSTCDQEGFAISDALWMDNGWEATVLARTSSAAPFDLVQLQFLDTAYQALGTGSFPIGTGDDASPDSCTTCVQLGEGCDDYNCSTSFYGAAGNIEITTYDRIGGTISGEITQLVAYEHLPGLSYVKRGGLTWCVDSLPFSASIDCFNSFDCTDAAAPTCAYNGRGVPECTEIGFCNGDDASEPNDGPSAAVPLSLGTPFDALICYSWGEADWFSFTLPTTQTVTVRLEWPGMSNDLEFIVWDETGGYLGDAQTSSNPEELTLTLDAGTYYVEVWAWYTGSDGDAEPYTILVQ